MSAETYTYEIEPGLLWVQSYPITPERIEQLKEAKRIADTEVPE